jgi:signal transduction histidine kinase
VNLEQLFAGAGEMAGLIRGTDWSTSALGPFEAWPQSLRTAVSICLGSRHPIVLWWGPERWMFYNDGYRPMLGNSKHPQFLGRPGQGCWAEIWDIIGPMMDQVIETGEATWSENLFLLMDRSGYLEETYYTFSYSPIRDETGRPSGIFNACSETTGRVLGDRRMKMLREMTVEARTASEAASLCAEVMGRSARDIPFALIYFLDDQRKHLRLAAHAGLPSGTPASPPMVEMTGATDTGWPLARVAELGRSEIVDDLGRRFDCLPREPWDEPAHQAMLLPITRPGWNQPAGVLVLGVSPRRAFDDDYRGFFDLVAGHVAMAVSNARAYEEERARAEKLAALDLVKTAFFSNVSHEFRTPLTLMLGPLEDSLVDRAEPLGDQHRTRITLAHDNAKRLLKLVNALLDFSSLEAGRMHAQFAPSDLAALTAEMAAMFQSSMEKAGIHFVIECPKLTEPVWVDRELWEKIVSNLISNAFKFTRTGEIAVRVRETDTHAELEVSDTGVGIPDVELPKIFERFHRVPGTTGRTHEGTGIGLSLVRDLVELHGGEVTASSVLGRGTKFRVEIPKGFSHLPTAAVSQTPSSSHGERTLRAHVAETAGWASEGEEPRSAREAAPSNAAASGIATGARVLVVDDNADLRAYFLGLLSPTYQVSIAVDGLAALDAIRASPPDIVVSDVMMPRLDGLGLVRALRADPTTASIPVILLSARAGEESAIEGLDTGADDYLVKPFSARELLARVRTHLHLAQTRRAWIAELEAKNQELESFSYSASHDLRAPLRAIDGFSQALAEDYAAKLDDQAKEHIRRVRSAVLRMSNLIEDLLRLARVLRGDLRRTSVDLSAMANEVAAQLREREPSRVATFKIIDGLVVDADAGLLRTVIENLIGNAWKFSAPRAESVIEVGVAERDGQRVYFVRDNGVGFDMAHADQLFRPFQRLHGEKDFAGSGIGLATVQRIVGRHGGRVWAEGIRDQGATVFLRL